MSKKRKIYLVDSCQPYVVLDMPSDHIAPMADVRYPSEYKKLVSYTLNWRTRLTFEAAAVPCMFVTLTYDNEHYLENRLIDNDIKSTLKDDWHKFSMRLHSHLKYHDLERKWRYYAITERGDDGRLHFHALIFGFDYKCFKGKNAKGVTVDYIHFNDYTDAIQQCWGNGFCMFEAVNEKAIAYVTKYIHKRRISGDYISLKSNGLGLSFLDNAKIKYFRETGKVVFHLGGKEYYLPRYLKQKIFPEDQLKQINERIMNDAYIKDFNAACKEMPDFDVNRYYVYEKNSQEIVDKIFDFDNSFYSQIDNYRLAFYDVGIYDYDKEHDEIYICVEEVDMMNFYLQKRRYFDNIRLKNIYKQRL